MESEEGEVVFFKNQVETMNKNVEEWMIEVENMMKLSV